MRSKIIDKTQDVIGQARKIFGYSRIDPLIEFCRNKRYSGTAYYQMNKLEFNLDMAEENFDEFIDTIIHEIAHLVVHSMYPTAKQAHGPEFRYVCSKLGGTGKTYHKFTSAPAKRVYMKTEYKVYCSCRHHWITVRQWNKIQAGVRIYCKHCGDTVYTPRIETRTVTKG